MKGIFKLNSLLTTIVLLLVAELLIGCSAIKSISMINSSKPLLNPNIPVEVSVPVEMKAHMMVVDVIINDLDRTYKFVLDTGAVTVFSERIASDLELNKEAKISIKDIAGNEKEAKLVTVSRFGIPGLEVESLAAVVTDIDKMDTQIDGILGSNYLQFFNVNIDYQKPSLSLSNAVPQVTAKTLIIPFEKNMMFGFAPTAECIVDGMTLLCMIDTGAAGFFSFPFSKIKKLPGYKQKNFVESNGSLIHGLHGSKGNDTVVGVSLFQMNDLKAANIAMTSNHLQGGNMTIGKDLLDDYKVSIDYPNDTLYLSPRPNSQEHSYPIYTFGFGMAKDEAEVMRVNGIWENSSIANAGIEIGDEVLTINDANVNELSMLQMMDMFFLEQREIDVTFRKKTGETRQTVIKREDLSKRVDHVSNPTLQELLIKPTVLYSPRLKP